MNTTSSKKINRISTNGLRMPFAEWLFRMSEAKVPYQARSLATYAVVFNVTGNEELAVLSGMDTRGHADKTYNKWKKYLSDNGWVLVIAVTKGRQTTIEVTPAFQESPVIFTDIKPKSTRKFYAGKSYGRTVDSTDETPLPAVEITDEPPSVVEITPVSSRDISASTRGLYNNLNNLNKTTTTTVEPRTRESGGGSVPGFESLNGTSFDLVSFIQRYANVPEDIARNMLKNNIQAFSEPAMVEAFSITQCDMATKVIATPYKYLIACAKRVKPGKGQSSGDSMRKLLQSKGQ